MTEIDLWDDDDELEVEVEVPEVGKGEVAVSLDDSNLTLFSVHDLRKREAFAVLAGLQTVELDEGVYRFRIYKNAGAMFALRYALTGLKVKGSAEDLSEMKALADKAPVPAAVLSEDRKFINIRVPRTPSYTNLLKTMTARPLGEGDYRVTVARAQDLNGHNQALPKYVPRIAFADSVTALLFAPIPGFDGTLESLKSISVEELNVIGSNAQAWKNLKNSKKTLAEKMGTMGISSLYDLIFFMPRRYIDKSTPQNIRDLIAGESATILGTIAGISSVGGIGGTRFKIESNGGGQIDAVFFRQEWLQTKFKRGEEVLVTGKVGFFNRELNLGGTSIEHSAEAAILPIVPIYKQSESKGITTNVILNAQRELFSRMGENLKMPPYFAKSKEIAYASAVRELHLPTSLAESKKSRELLAYMEFVQMQIIMHELKQSKSQETGLINAEGPSKLQRQAINSLPFTMTKGQQNAVSYLNDEMAAERPVSVLLNADVGAGKGLLKHEKVLTPSGWREVGTLKVGDRITGSAGKSTAVTGVFPQGLQKLARVSFSDGTSVVTDLAHRWTVMPMGVYPGKFPSGRLPRRVISTEQLLSSGPSEVMFDQVGNGGSVYSTSRIMKTHFEKSKGVYRWKIPIMSGPAQYADAQTDLPIDPYLLGYWLGDGEHNALNIAVGKDDVDATEELLAKCWPGTIERAIDKRNGHFSLRLKTDVRGTGRNLLRSIGVYSNKHVPDMYLKSTPEVRLAVLQGLMDSDGYVSRRGDLDFGNNNKRIIDGFLDLVRGLGGIAKISRIRHAQYTDAKGEKVRSKNESYSVNFSLPRGAMPARLMRKADRYAHKLHTLPKRSHSFTKSIVNVERLDEKGETVCIKVAARDELFITRDYIVTHNTLLAQLACLRAVEAGRQAIIVAPATILARQLYDTLQTLLSRLSIDVDARLLLGDTKATERKKILKGLAEGTVQIAVGSTSLLSEAVEYNDLGFVCFDEQQKFGVNHRTKILSRRSDGRVPDFMMQTATPVPRSTAQVFYGDMDMIELDDKPEGRLPIETEWLNERPQEVLEQLAHPVWEDIKEEASKGNQTFIITPLVNDSESIDAASVKKTHEVLSNGPLSSLNVGIVHGQMKPDLARDAMADFRAKKYDVLVASTAVEVGVDIPDATRVVVLSADRLGASSLHQIRGRVGRSNKPSTCSLISQTEVPGSIRRLQALVDSSNGYDIAQVDLETRGEGQLFGVEQSGGATLRFGSILTHRHLVEAASKEADRILASPLREMAIQDAKLTFNAEERFV